MVFATRQVDAEVTGHSVVAAADRSRSLHLRLPRFCWHRVSELRAEPGSKTETHCRWRHAACHVPVLLCRRCGGLHDGSVSVSQYSNFIPDAYDSFSFGNKQF